MSEDMVSVPQQDLRGLFHDLNNLLAALNGSVGYLAKKIGEQEELQARVRHLQKCVERGVELAQRIDRLSNR